MELGRIHTRMRQKLTVFFYFKFCTSAQLPDSRAQLHAKPSLARLLWLLAEERTRSGSNSAARPLYGMSQATTVASVGLTVGLTYSEKSQLHSTRLQ